MFAILVPVIAAALIGVALGGSIRGLARPVRWWPLGVGSLLGELALAQSPVAHEPLLLAWGHWVWAATVVCVLLVLGRNALATAGAARAAWSLAASGLILNLAVVVANGGYMPVAGATVAATGSAAQLETAASYRRDVPLTEQTQLAWLACVIAEPDWVPRASILSLGDLLLMAGLAACAFGATAAAAKRARVPADDQREEQRFGGLDAVRP
jgi:hypothetical protein